MFELMRLIGNPIYYTADMLGNEQDCHPVHPGVCPVSKKHPLPEISQRDLYEVLKHGTTLLAAIYVEKRRSVSRRLVFGRGRDSGSISKAVIWKQSGKLIGNACGDSSRA